MPSRRSGARAAARASLGIDGALALLRSHPLTHSLHVVVPSSSKRETKERERRAFDDDGRSGSDGDAAPPRPPPPPPSSPVFDLLPKPPPYFCVPALNLADLTTPQFVAWAFPEEDEEDEDEAGKEGGESWGLACGACGLAAPASLDAGGGAALAPDGRLLVALPAEERARAGDVAPGASRRDPGAGGGGGAGGAGWYLSEVFLTAGRGARARAKAREGKKGEAAAAATEEAMEEEGEGGGGGAAARGATAAAAAASAAAPAAAAEAEHRPLARARERLAAATLFVPFALLPPRASSSSRSKSTSSFSPPPLPGAREVSPRERRRLGARAPLPSFPDFAGFFGRRKKKLSLPEGKQQASGSSARDRSGEEEEMEVDDEKEVEEAGPEAPTAAAAAAKEEEEEREEEGEIGGDDDRERLAEALEWLGLAASLSSPSVTLAEGASEEGRNESESEAAGFVDVCSFEGLLGSGFAIEALEAAAAAVGAADGELPWAVLVLVGFPDSPLSWTTTTPTAEGRAKAAARGEGGGGGGGGRRRRRKAFPTSTAVEPVRLGPEACREHALFVVVVDGGVDGCRFLAAVASGGGDGFASGLL